MLSTSFLEEIMAIQVHKFSLSVACIFLIRFDMDLKSIFVIFFMVFGEISCIVVFTCPSLRYLKNGRIRIRHRGRFARFFCNSGYSVAGERYSSCERVGSRLVWSNPIPKCVRNTCPKTNITAPTNGLIYPSHSGAVLNFYCKSGYNLNGPKTTYCDGEQWSDNLPTCIENGSKPKLFCDFETEDICGWSHDLNHDFDWRRENFKTPSGSIGTGPSFDHTKGNGSDGYYMYIESSSRSENDTARLISPVFDSSQTDICFEFFYHMYGITTGSLNVYVKKISENFGNLKPFFEKSGNQGDRWYRGYHLLGPMDEEYQIIIEGIRGPGYISDIAVDDVKIIENCVYQDFTTTTEDTTNNYSEKQLPLVQSCQNRCGQKSNDSNQSDFIVGCDCDDSCYDNNRCCPDFFDMCIQVSTSEGNLIESISTDIPYYETTSKEIEQFTTENLTKTTLTLKPLKISTFKPHPTTQITVTNSTTINKQNPTTKLLVTSTRKPSSKIVWYNKTVVTVKKTMGTTLKPIKTTLKPTTTTLKPVKTTLKPVKTTLKPAKVTQKQMTITKSKIRTPLVMVTPPTTQVIVQKILLTTKPVKISKKVDKKYDERNENDVNHKVFIPNDEISFDDRSEYDNFDVDYRPMSNFDTKTNFVISNGDEAMSNYIPIIVGASVFILGTLIVSSIVFIKYKSGNFRRRGRSSISQSDVRFLTEEEVLDFSIDNRNDEDDNRFYNL